MNAVTSILALLLASALPSPVMATCAPQPMPPAIDAAGQLPHGAVTIEFAATPSLESPGRAWVVRLARGGREATLEVVRLRREYDCNRYDVEARWASPLGPGEFDAAAAALAPLGLPPANLLSPILDGTEMILDGTGVRLRLSHDGWQVDRALNHFTRDGRAISAIFRRLVVTHVPADKAPTEDWRTPRP